MDPDETYRLLVEAIADGDDAAAHEHATRLLAWLDKGGSLPAGQAREFLHGYLRDTIRRTRP